MRNETELGLADLTKRFSAAGLAIIEQHGMQNREATYFAIGNSQDQTNIVVPHEFLDDLPNTKEHQTAVDSYAHAVSGRLRCGSPEVFYCQSGIAIRVSIQWPIHGAVGPSGFSSHLLMVVKSLADDQIAKCSIELGGSFSQTEFDIVALAVNSVRRAIDDGKVTFYDPHERQEKFPTINRQQARSESLRQSEIERFIAGKARVLGFLAVKAPSDVWAGDPWDAEYLGVTTKDMLLAMRVLRAKGLLEPGLGSEHARPSDKLLHEWSENREEETPFKAQRNISRSNLPTKEELLKDLRMVIEHHTVWALLVIDLDHFKTVNDTKGHPEGDACLDRVVSTIGAVVGRKGKVYRWGGDEFAVCLPDFSTEEAQVTAERIRSAVEQSRPGGDIVVTTSIGVCASDRTDSRRAEEILDLADKAMYKSKTQGKNRVTTWPIERNSVLPVAATEKQPKRALKAQLAQFLKEGKNIQEGIHYNNPDSLRQKQDWEHRVEEYLGKNLGESYAVRFGIPSHQLTSYPAGINSKMTAPWGDTGAKMAMLNDFMSELRG
jgi:diguanylate cyclase (GGDEF)-like protein